MAKKKVNYLNNKDILKEIHKSKLSFCHSIDEAYNHVDIIVHDVDEITEETIDQAKINRAARLSSAGYEAGIKKWHDEYASKGVKPKQIEFKVYPEEIKNEDLVFRVMTFEHVPLAPGRKKNPKTVADHHARCNFPPFKQYALINDEWTEVVRSHWKDGFGNGSFCLTHGRINPTLANMMIKLCDRYSMRANWRGYSYVDEMRASALVQLSQVGLQFNEDRSDNPFAYYSRVLENSFTRVFNLEKRNQNIRDDILQDSGYMPSFNRQMTDEENQQAARKETNEAEKQAEELEKAGYNII